MTSCAEDLKYNKAIFYGRRGEHRKSVELFDELIKEDSSNYKLFHNRGISKQRYDDNYGAIEDYSSAIALKKDHLESYINRGVAKMRLGFYEEAIPDLKRAIEIDGKSGLAYKNLGNAYLLQDNFIDACNCWHEAKKLGEDTEDYIRINCSEISVLPRIKG